MGRYFFCGPVSLIGTTVSRHPTAACGGKDFVLLPLCSFILLYIIGVMVAPRLGSDASPFLHDSSMADFMLCGV